MFNTFFDSLLTLLFPDRCAGCNKPGALLCSACRAGLRPYPSRPIAGLDDVVVAYIFSGALRPAIHSLKYNKSRRLAVPLADLMNDRFAQASLAVDAILPVPLHASRQHERGFNQSELLARRVATRCHVPLLTNGLTRVRATDQQARLDARARRTNMRHAFAWQSPLPPPARILIVDDVLTTGSTVVACADALRAAGTRTVYALALARSRPGE